VAEFVDGGRSFILRADPYNPRDSIQFYEWQVTYGQGPAGYHPTGWISGVTGSGTLPQRIVANVPRNKAPAGATILPIHIYSSDPNPEPFPGLRLDITNDGNFWIYEGGGGGARDSIQFYEWQMLLAPADAAPARPGWISGVTVRLCDRSRTPPRHSPGPVTVRAPSQSTPRHGPRPVSAPGTPACAWPGTPRRHCENPRSG
jgi:hypothetical protein